MNNKNKPERFAMYLRYSSEMQSDLSLEAQEHRCREEIAKRNGRVVAVHSDAAISGWSADRPGLQEMIKNASKNKYDAIMLWKFDRLARDNQQVMIIKSMLRSYGVNLYCVEGASEDDAEGMNSWLMEQTFALFAAMFSKSLSIETKRGKKQRAVNGEFNGSCAPFGYDLVTKKNATLQQPAGLYINVREAVLVRRAFRMYASGKHSTTTIADWLNERSYVQKVRKNKLPFGKGTVRDLLQNKVYTGRVCHADTQYTKTLGEGKRSTRKRKVWYEGKHQPIICDELYNLAQEQRKHLTKTRHSPTATRTYALHDRVICSHCLVNKPSGLIDRNYGKMRARWYGKRDYGMYVCIARDRGYHQCKQQHIRVDSVDKQVAEALINLEIPIGVKERVENAVRNRVENEEVLNQIEAIRQKIERIDFKFEEGFMSKEEYVEKRNQLQIEVQTIQPIDYDNLIEAEDLLTNFKQYWSECRKQPDPDKARQQLLTKIVQQVYVYNQKVIGISLYGDFGVIIGGEINTPSNIGNLIRTEIKKGASNNTACTQNGSDEI